MQRLSLIAGQFFESAKLAVQRVIPRSVIRQRLRMVIQVGDKIPGVDLYEEHHEKKVNIAELCDGKKIILFAVPGAFTPNCSQTHLPGYVNKAEDLKARGIAEIFCVAVNDPFVMNAWAKEHKCEGKVRMLADPNADFTKALDLQTEVPFLGGVRSKRYSMVVENGVVKELNVEPDGIGLTCTLAEKLSIS